jgi:sortase (surface protein transpeptidase)
MLTHRRFLCILLIFLVICVVTVGNSLKVTDGVFISPSPSPFFFFSTQLSLPETNQPERLLTNLPTPQPTIKAPPSLSMLGSGYNANLPLNASPVYIPLELIIPVLKVDSPMLGVGVTSDNSMDAPKGPYDDPIWHTAFWFRGSSIPGDVGTATIAAHVDDLVGRPEIFAFLKRLHPGDLIIIHAINTSRDLRFVVDQVQEYSNIEASTPAVLTKIFGSGPVAGIGPQPSSDGLSHLTLLTCAGNFVNGGFDHHTVVYATLSK